MNKKLTFTGGEPDITIDNLLYNSAANRSALFGVAEGLGGSGDMIISGCSVTVSAGTSATTTAGYIWLNNEILQVDTQTVSESLGTDLWEFQKATTYDSDGDKTFNDGTSRQTYQQNRGVLVNVGSISGLDAVNGDSLNNLLSRVLTLESDVDTNTSNISTNASNISANASNISTNTSNISTNTSNISTNTSNISTNTSAIANNGVVVYAAQHESDLSSSTVNVNSFISSITQSGDIYVLTPNITLTEANYKAYYHIEGTANSSDPRNFNAYYEDGKIKYRFYDAAASDHSEDHRVRITKWS